MRQIIVLNNLQQTDQTFNINCAFWLVPPVSQIRPLGTAGTTAVTNATGPELAAIQSGSVVEQIYSAVLPFSISIPSVGSSLISRYNEAQRILSAGSVMKNYTNTYYDGTAWFNLPT